MTHLLRDADIALYLEEMLGDGDMRAVPVALRSVADAVGGMNALSEKTGVSRSTIYRAVSDKGNARLDTLAAILAAFGLRLSVRRAGGGKKRGGTLAEFFANSPLRESGPKLKRSHKLRRSEA